MIKFLSFQRSGRKCQIVYRYNSKCIDFSNKLCLYYFGGFWILFF